MAINAELGKTILELRDKMRDAESLLSDARQEFDAMKHLFEIASAEFLERRWKRALFEHVTREKFQTILTAVSNDYKQEFGIDYGHSLQI